MRAHRDIHATCAAAVAGCSLIAAGCAGGPAATVAPSAPVAALASARRVGAGPRFRPLLRSPLVARGAPVDGLRCGVRRPPRAAAHVEVFADDHVVLIAAGIGVAPPLSVHGAYVSGGSCTYPLRTSEPTGLLLLQARARFTLGQLFDLWGQPLGRERVAGFHTGAGHPVRVFIDGRAWAGSPRSAPVRSGTQIAVELGSRVPPHVRYTFPPAQAIAAMR
jgi:hypothetical protein